MTINGNICPLFRLELAAGSPDPLDEILHLTGQGSSNMCGAEELVETSLGEGEMSHQSSLSDPLSPTVVDYSDDDPDQESDMSSDVEINN